MKHHNEDIQYCEKLLARFHDIGSLDSGGVTRLGYTEVEDEMHQAFTELAEELGCKHIQDEVGNTFALNSEQDDYYLVGSHLDSVISGGRYDGVVGVIAGLMILRWAKEDGLNIPIRVGAFRCEESSNFGIATVGSGLITGDVSEENLVGRLSKAGIAIEDIFSERGYTLKPNRISGIRQYLELHIEQGKVLEETNTEVGIVAKIAGPRRFSMHIQGMAEHSGATPMNMRNDALCGAAEMIIGLEKIGQRESEHNSVTTVGIIENYPNVMNVVPGEVKLGIDIRGIDIASLDRIEHDMKELAEEICQKRHIDYRIEKTSETAPVLMSSNIENELEKTANKLGITSRRMPSGAGHDAMSFAHICETGMVFIPCQKGVSHNPAEYTSVERICDGARIIYEHIKEDAQ